MKFEDIAWALTPYITSSKEVLRAAKAIEDIIPNLDGIKSPDGIATYSMTEHRWIYQHDYLVTLCLGSNKIMEYVKLGQKISAIKELRNLTNAGLKQSKEAVEDRRVVFIDYNGDAYWASGEMSRYNPDPE